MSGHGVKSVWSRILLQITPNLKYIKMEQFECPIQIKRDIIFQHMITNAKINRINI